MILWRLLFCSTHTHLVPKLNSKCEIRNNITELFTYFSVHTFGYMANITWVRYPKQNDIALFFLFQSTIQAEVPATIPALPKNVVKESVAKNDIPTGKVLQKKCQKFT